MPTYIHISLFLPGQSSERPGKPVSSKNEESLEVSLILSQRGRISCCQRRLPRVSSKSWQQCPQMLTGFQDLTPEYSRGQRVRPGSSLQRGPAADHGPEPEDKSPHGCLFCLALTSSQDQRGWPRPPHCPEQGGELPHRPLPHPVFTHWKGLTL